MGIFKKIWSNVKAVVARRDGLGSPKGSYRQKFGLSEMNQDQVLLFFLGENSGILTFASPGTKRTFRLEPHVSFVHAVVNES
jgi:hypothetical protein